MEEQQVRSPQIDNEWRRWVAENLMLGQTEESIQRVMVEKGFTPQIAELEIKLAAANPYFKGAEIICNRLRKRDWQLAVYRKLSRLHSKSGQIERRHKLTRRELIDEYYSAHRPVIITGMMEDWPAMTKWNLEYFERNFGDRVVEVQSGRDSDANYEDHRDKYRAKMKLAEFIAKIRTSGPSNDLYITANNTPTNKHALAGLWDDLGKLPEYLDTKHPDELLWFGPAGTITPFHHDLTNNFMAQVIGSKRIKLAPSWDTPLMKNNYYVYSQIDGRATPPMPDAPSGQPQIMECVIKPGELLFLPIGWWHFVEGLEMSVTITFLNFAVDNDFKSFYPSKYRKLG